MPHQLETRNPKLETGFTLIELLVVVGIIVILIAILVPAVGAARRQAKVAETNAQLTGIGQNITQYATDNLGSFPGPVKDADVCTAPNSFTSCHNLCLGTARFWGLTNTGMRDPNPTAWSFAGPPASQVYGDRSPQSPLYNYATSRAMPSYFGGKASDIQTVTSTGLTGAGATFPVMVDRFSDPLPILYYRKTRGVDGTAAGSALLQLNPAAGVGAFYSYANGAYSGGINSATVNVTSPSGAVFPQLLRYSDLQTMLQNNNTNPPLPLGGFVLIAAGPLRIYGPKYVNGTSTGTSDNIIVAGGQ